MPALYEMDYSEGVGEVLEDLRRRLCPQFGVTLVGNRLTVRWDMRGQPVDAHMIIENVMTVEEGRDLEERCS
jgi:hypothetical protein